MSLKQILHYLMDLLKLTIQSMATLSQEYSAHTIILLLKVKEINIIT